MGLLVVATDFVSMFYIWNSQTIKKEKTQWWLRKTSIIGLQLPHTLMHICFVQKYIHLLTFPTPKKGWQQAVLEVGFQTQMAKARLASGSNDRCQGQNCYPKCESSACVCVCVCTYTCMWTPHDCVPYACLATSEARRGWYIPRTGVTDSSEPPHGCWNWAPALWKDSKIVNCWTVSLAPFIIFLPKIKSCCVVQAGFKPSIFLPLPPK